MTFEIPHPRDCPHGRALGDTEYDIAPLVVDGLTNHQIADRVVIGFETERDHLEVLYDHFEVCQGLKSRSRAALAAVLARFSWGRDENTPDRG